MPNQIVTLSTKITLAQYGEFVNFFCTLSFFEFLRKYSSIYRNRYTLVMMWHSFFFSCIFKLESRSMGSSPKPYMTVKTSSFDGNSQSLTGMQLILHWTTLPLLSLKSMQYAPLYRSATWHLPERLPYPITEYQQA